MAEENKDASAEGAEAPKPKKKLPLLMIGLGLQTVMVLVASFLIIKGTVLAPKPNFTKQAMVDRAIASVSLRDNEDDIQLLNLDEFTVNVSNSHALRAKIQVEVSNPKVLGALNSRLPAVKQRVLDILSRSVPGGIHGLHTKLRIKEAIRESLNRELIENGYKDGIVREVYFMDMVII